jgi:hypothetical protein
MMYAKKMLACIYHHLPLTILSTIVSFLLVMVCEHFGWQTILNNHYLNELLSMGLIIFTVLMALGYFFLETKLILLLKKLIHEISIFTIKTCLKIITKMNQNDEKYLSSINILTNVIEMCLKSLNNMRAVEAEHLQIIKKMLSCASDFCLITMTKLVSNIEPLLSKHAKDIGSEWSARLSLGCKLTFYQNLLSKLTIDSSIDNLEWTDIYPVNKLLDEEQKELRKHRHYFNDSEAKVKRQIIIIHKKYVGQWQTDYDNGKVGDFETKIRENGGEVKYIAEDDLKKLDLTIGDYAIFNRNIVLSFNPTTEDDENGDLWVSPHKIEPYSKIFDKMIDTKSYTFGFRNNIMEVLQKMSGKLKSVNPTGIAVADKITVLEQMPGE